MPVPVQVPPPGTSWPSGHLRPREHLERWRPAAAAVAAGGLAGQQAGRRAQGGTPRGPLPASRGESRLRVINGFPGSRGGAGARARAGSQPAQHPGRLPQLSSPTSFAPSSGDEPPWSLQALRMRPRSTGRLGRPAWVSRSPPRGWPSPRPSPATGMLGAHTVPLCGISPTEHGRPRAPAPLRLQDIIAALQPRLLGKQQQPGTLPAGYQRCFTAGQLPVQVRPGVGVLSGGRVISLSLLGRGRETGTKARRNLFPSV